MRRALSVLAMLACTASLAGSATDAARRAVETVGSIPATASGAAAFAAGKDLANSTHGNAAVKAAITPANAANKVPGYATTHERSSLFADGGGDLVTPGKARVDECKATKYADASRQVECDAVNDVARNRSLRPPLTIQPNDPILAKGKAVKNALDALSESFQGKYGACQSKTVTTPATYTEERCTDLKEVDLGSCVYGRRIDIDADSNFQCDKTLTTLSTQERTTSINTSRCVYGRRIDIDADSNFQCDKTTNAYETQKCYKTLNVVVNTTYCAAGTLLHSFSVTHPHGAEKVTTINIRCTGDGSTLKVEAMFTGWCYWDYRRYWHSATVRAGSPASIATKGTVLYYVNTSYCPRHICTWSDAGYYCYYDYETMDPCGTSVHGPIASMNPDKPVNNVLFGSFFRRGCMVELLPSSACSDGKCNIYLRYINQYNWDDSRYPDYDTTISASAISGPSMTTITHSWVNGCSTLESRARP